MSNKYEREIEEILRNLERSEPAGGAERRHSPRMPRRTGPRRSLSLPRLTFPEWCLLIAVVAALVGGGWAQAAHSLDGGGTLITGIIALIGAVCLVLVATSNFIARPRYQTPASRYNNVTRLPGNPLRRMATSWHLLLLKMRYRRRNKRGD